MYVPLNYPDLNPQLAWTEQRRGFKIEWEDESFLPARMKDGAEALTTQINLKVVRLRARSQPGDVVLLRSPLRERTEDEALALIKERVVGFVYLEKDGTDWVAKHPSPMPGQPGGPPATVSTKILARGASLLALLADLEIRVVSD